MDHIEHLPLPTIEEFDLETQELSSQITWSPPYKGLHTFADFGNLACGSRSQVAANRTRNNLRVWLSCNYEHIDDSDSVHGKSSAFFSFVHPVSSTDKSLEVVSSFENLKSDIYIRLKNQGWQSSSCEVNASLDAFIVVYVKRGGVVSEVGNHTKRLVTPIVKSEWMPGDGNTRPHPNNVAIQSRPFEIKAKTQLPTNRDESVIFRTGLRATLSAWLNDVEIKASVVAAGVVPKVVSRPI